MLGVSKVLRAEIATATDEQLVSWIVNNSSEGFYSELFTRYKKKVYLWCYRYTNNDDDAIDLTQEIFIKVFENVHKFAGLSSFSSWVYSITRNHCLGHLSKKDSKAWKDVMQLKEEILYKTYRRNGTDAVEIANDLYDILNIAKGYMKEDELYAFILHYKEGLSVKEVTKMLGCENISGARTLIQNARRKFDKLIKEKDFRNE
jgi:RNA polymerase sigma-70 factor (ECF subfamily)